MSALALNISPEDMPYEAEMPAGRAALNRSFYGPITEAMATGPRRVGDLLALPDLEGRRDNPAELIGILVGLDLAEPAARPGAEPTPQALRFNRVDPGQPRPDREPRPSDRRGEPRAGHGRAVHAVRPVRDRTRAGRRERGEDG